MPRWALELLRRIESVQLRRRELASMALLIDVELAGIERPSREATRTPPEALDGVDEGDSGAVKESEVDALGVVTLQVVEWCDRVSSEWGRTSRRSGCV
jgi:hypothetical protein